MPVLIQRIWGGAQNVACPTSSQVMLICWPEDHIGGTLLEVVVRSDINNLVVGLLFQKSSYVDMNLFNPSRDQMKHIMDD